MSNKRDLTTDAFGHTTQVVEYRKDTTGAYTGTYTTQYTYDWLGNLTCVNQSSQYRVFTYDTMGRLTWVDNPETRVQAISSCTAGGTGIKYEYDNAGNLTKKTDTGNFVTTYHPDLLNRVDSKTTIDGATTYSFDQSQAIPGEADTDYPIGRLNSVSFGAVTQTFRHDALGRYKSSAQAVTGQANSPFVFHYEYKPAGLASEKYPAGRTVATSYDIAGRPSGATGYTTGVTYAPHGAMAGVTFANGVQESWSYNARLKPTCLTAAVGTASPLLQLTNVYTAAAPGGGGACGLSGTDNNGNVVKQTIGIGTAAFNQSYGYADGLNRITSAGETNTNGTSAGLGWSQGFAYNDAWGNRTLTSPTITSGWSYPTSFDATNQVTAGAGWSSTPDNRGNLATTPELTMTYDAESRLKTAAGTYGTTSFVYDGDGRRVKATHGGTDTVYVYDAMGQLAAEYGGVATGAGTEFVTADHLGSTRLVTGAGGAVMERHDYAPFGEEILPQGCELPAGAAGRSARCDIAGYGAAGGVPLQFTGKERDGNTGLDYFGAKYFSAAQGRFTSPDEFVGGPYEVGGSRPSQPGPLPYADITNSQSLNKYAYALNNPLRYVDPDGHEVVLSGEANDREEAKRRILANASKKGEAALFNTVTDKSGKTLVLDKAAAANFSGTHSKGYNMLVQTINSKNAVTVAMDSFDSRTKYQGNNATVFLSREVSGIDRVAPMRDPQGNVVPMPFGIIAGHEVLGHARLHLLGDPGAYFDGSGSKTFQIENILRREQGLPLRPNDQP